MHEFIDSTRDLPAPPLIFNLSQFLQVMFAANRAMFQDNIPAWLLCDNENLPKRAKH